MALGDLMKLPNKEQMQEIVQAVNTFVANVSRDLEILKANDKVLHDGISVAVKEIRELRAEVANLKERLNGYERGTNGDGFDARSGATN